MTTDPLYTAKFPHPQLPAGTSEVTFVHGLAGFIDAGNAVHLATEHLLNALESELVAEFAMDEIVDYCGRRPTLVMHDGRLTEYHLPELKLWLVYDNAGKPFLLLSGYEPDFRWEAIAAAVMSLLDDYNVTTSVGLYAAALAVPHTRAVPLLHHGSSPREQENLTSWQGTMHFSANFTAFLDYRLQEKDFHIDGFTAQVPNYLSQSHFSPAALQLLNGLSECCGLSIPTGSLTKDSADLQQEIDDQLNDNPELLTVVASIEDNYDSFKEEHERKLREQDQLKEFAQNLLDSDRIDAELEEFLSQVDFRHRQQDDSDK